MNVPSGLKVLFVAGFGPIVKDPAESKRFYVDTLGLPLEPMQDNESYYHGDKIEGVKHFALWPLEQAALSCFDKKTWPAHLPQPHSWLELDVEDVASSTRLLKDRGFTLLIEARKEPWGQTVTRLLSPEGILLGLTYTPWLR